MNDAVRASLHPTALPIAIGAGGSDASFRSPMAIAVIGGLVTSTFLSLLVIPVAYTYLDDFNNWIRSLRPRLMPLRPISEAVNTQFPQ
jgi:hypothetical protein